MSLTPSTPNEKPSKEVVKGSVELNQNRGLPTPENSPLVLPNNFKYYNCHLNKSQFNNILIHCVVNLLKITYGENIGDVAKLKFFIVEILKRSKTSIQVLQLTCWYIMRLLHSNSEDLPSDPRKLFLGMVIIASKFNQDYNYSFKSWLKICGIGESHTFNLSSLKALEITCLGLLNYELCLNNLKYENWCNILVIFGYDFLKLHLVTSDSSQLIWYSENDDIEPKLLKWKKFFKFNLNMTCLSSVKIQFNNYYIHQLGKKIIFKSSMTSTPSLFSNKRCADEVAETEYDSKKAKYIK